MIKESPYPVRASLDVQRVVGISPPLRSTRRITMSSLFDIINITGRKHKEKGMHFEFDSYSEEDKDFDFSRKRGARTNDDDCRD